MRCGSSSSGKDGSGHEALTAETCSTSDIAVEGSGLSWSQFYKVYKRSKSSVP